MKRNQGFLTLVSWAFRYSIVRYNDTMRADSWVTVDADYMIVGEGRSKARAAVVRSAVKKGMMKVLHNGRLQLTPLGIAHCTEHTRMNII